MLYALARDNEISFLAYTVGQQHPEILRCLAAAALEQGEPDAKWQLAVELGREGTLCAEAEGLLLRMAQEEGDENEYVRRRALKELATLNSLHTEQLALTAWNEPGENQQWARMAALWSLHRVQAPSLERLLAESEVDTRPHLSAYAQRMRRGEADE